MSDEQRFFPTNAFDVRATGDEVYLRMGVAVWDEEGSKVVQTHTAVLSYPAFINFYAMLQKFVADYKELQGVPSLPLIHGEITTDEKETDSDD